MISTLALFAAAQALATPQLEPMAFLVGHCWRGEFPNGSADTHCFEPVYNGRFIRDRHEVTDGARPYAGETIYGWNAAAGRVEYTYWTLPGGISRGSMTAREGMLDFGDELHRDRTGREIRIGTTWRRIDDTSYEVRVTSTSDPTGNRVTRYTRADLAPIRIDVSMASDTSRTLTHEMVIAAPTEAIYTAVGTVDGWRSWAVPNAWQLPDTGEQFEASYRPGARVGEPGNIVQQFLVRLPNRMVAFRTVRTPPGFPHASAFQRVTNVFELEPFGSATRVRLTSAGYPTGAAGDALLAFFREGNRTSLEQLRTRFATGPIDWAARQSAAANR